MRQPFPELRDFKPIAPKVVIFGLRPMTPFDQSRIAASHAISNFFEHNCYMMPKKFKLAIFRKLLNTLLMRYSHEVFSEP